MGSRFHPIFALFAILLVCYSQLTTAAPIGPADNGNHKSSIINRGSLQQHNDNSNENYDNSATNVAEDRLQSRTNIMPGIERLLPILSAFGNVGQSGHKEGGKAPVPVQ